MAGALEDAGAYHVGSIRWLSEYGTVHGSALIVARFGFVSSWFAWSAALNHGELVGRIGTVMNGLLLLLCLGQLLVVTLRLWRKTAAAADLLVLFAWIIMLPSFFGWDMRTSPSPDIPLLIFGVVIAWAMLVIEPQAGSRAIDLDAALARARLMVLLLGTGAFLIKVSGAPLLAASALYYVWAQRQGWITRCGIAALTCTAMLGVLAAAGVISSGCAFYPSALLCTDLPWSVGREGAQAMTEVIRQFARGNLDQPQLQGPALIMAWIRSNADSTRWMVLSIIAGAWLLLRRSQLNVAGLGWASMIGFIGLPFLLLTAPAGRFGTTYIIILPLLVLVALCDSLGHLLRRIARPATLRRMSIAITALGVVYMAMPLYKEFIYSRLRAISYASLAHRKQGNPSLNELNARWWLVPNRYADAPGFTSARAYDFDYAMPPKTTSLCWHHALPCSYESLAHVRLRDVKAGLSAGFVREARVRQ